MTTIDWNWFFAAFAQCAAGLIAIIGAFIISKLLGEAEKEEIHGSNTDQLIIQFNDLTKRISGRNFTWYDKRNIEYSSELAEAIQHGDFNGLNDAEKLQKLYSIETDLFGTLSCLEALNERIEKLTPKTSYISGGLSIVHTPLNINLPPNGLWEKISKERDIVNQLQIESETLIEKFEKVKKDILITKNNLTPIKTTIYILGIGLLLTVIYPLHFMPLELNKRPTLGFSFELVLRHIFSVKGILLFLLTVVIEGIFGYFLWLIDCVEKKYNATTLRLVDKYFSIIDYCQYFK
jgi:hypothetical protein